MNRRRQPRPRIAAASQRAGHLPPTSRVTLAEPVETGEAQDCARRPRPGRGTRRSSTPGRDPGRAARSTILLSSAASSAVVRGVIRSEVRGERPSLGIEALDAALQGTVAGDGAGHRNEQQSGDPDGDRRDHRQQPASARSRPAQRAFDRDGDAAHVASTAVATAAGGTDASCGAHRKRSSSTTAERGRVRHRGTTSRTRRTTPMRSTAGDRNSCTASSASRSRDGLDRTLGPVRLDRRCRGAATSLTGSRSAARRATAKIADARTARARRRSARTPGTTARAGRRLPRTPTWLRRRVDDLRHRVGDRPALQRRAPRRRRRAAQVRSSREKIGRALTVLMKSRTMWLATNSNGRPDALIAASLMTIPAMLHVVTASDLFRGNTDSGRRSTIVDGQSQSR